MSSTWRRRNLRVIQRSSRAEVMAADHNGSAAARYALDTHRRAAPAAGRLAGLEAEKGGGIAVQEVRAGRRCERGVRAHQAPDVLLTERIGVVGAEHHALLAHDAHQEIQRLVTEYRAVDREAVEVGRGQVGAVLAHDVAVAPGVVDAPEEVGEAAAAV